MGSPMENFVGEGGLSPIIVIVAGAVALILGLVVGILIGRALRKRFAESKIGSAEKEAKRLLDEAAKDAEIKLIALRALTEISRAMSKEYGVPLDELLCFSENLIARYENKLLGDPVSRVGRDTKRKLSATDRFVGAARLCAKHGIRPVNILAGLAAGLHFAPADDEAALAVSATARDAGVPYALATYSGITEEDGFIEDVEAVYSKIAAGTEIREIISSLQIY